MSKFTLSPFFIKTTVVCMLMIVVACVFILFDKQITDPIFFLFTPLLAYLINIGALFAAKSKPSQKSFSMLITSLFGIKFFSYILLSIIFFLFHKSTHIRVIYILFIFVVYIFNTVVLLTELLKFFKTIEKKDEISK